MKPPAFTIIADLISLQRGMAYADTADVKGDVAEFGTFHGTSSEALAASMVTNDRRLWLFDSFEGLPDLTAPEDDQSPHGQSGAWRWKDRIEPARVLGRCIQHITDRRINLIPGWFAETLPTIPADTKFALVHIDCDLYSSTYEVLDHLFANRILADGALIYFDDWYCNRGSPRFGEQKAWADVDKCGYSYSDVGAYGLMGRRFIIHEE